MTNLNRVAIKCSNDSRHQMFRETDGVRCVECESIMIPTPVSEEDYRRLPSYINWWREQRKQKPKQSISIAVEADTNKLQLKLKAIAKHAEALANELDAIDNAWQCDCGSSEYEDTEMFKGEEVYFSTRTCLKCNEQYAIPNDDDLPTRLEGSD